MLNLDSVKLQFDKNLISFKPDKFYKKTEEIEDVELTSYRMKPIYKKTGIKSIMVNDNNCTIEMSSKLIPGLYHNMINNDTVNAYLDEINKLELISFNADEVIENSNVLTCDVTNNMKVSNVAMYVNTLTIFKINDKYNYKQWLDESITFDRKVKTPAYREHLIIYNKEPELLTAKNKDFRNEIDMNYFKNVLRFESKYWNHELMRKLFEIEDNSLSKILNSKAKVNYKILDRITDIKNIDVETFTNYKSLISMKEKYKYSKLRNIQGDLSILHTCNYDIDLVKLFFKTNSTANNSKYIRHMKSLLKAKNEIDKHTGIDEKVSEMKEFLKVA